MAETFAFHGQEQYWCKRKKNVLELILITNRSATIHSVYARCEPDNEEKLVQMEPIKRTEAVQYWQGTIPLNQDQPSTLYLFKLVFNDKQLWVHGAGTSSYMPGQEKHFRYNSQDHPPSWVCNQVFYQIFPDRFCNGNPAITVKTDEYPYQGGQRRIIQKAWGSDVSNHEEGTGATEFFGGDLKGIRSKLDYLQELGVTALYLNPVFCSPSNHKYDTTDYTNIDPHLGSNEEFSDLVCELHNRDMKIVLDAVFNHTSEEHNWFDKYDVYNNGAFHSTTSPYRNYYFFNGDTQQYIGWNGISTLPKLNYENPDVRNTIYAGEKAIIRQWLREPYKIDGWRFDVIHMLGEGSGAKNNVHYVKAFRQATKEENPDAYILGEHFFEASKWLQGDQEDGAMNYYGFTHPVRAFLAGQDIAYHPIKITAEEFALWLAEARSKMPFANQLTQLNLLDSHDTTRFKTLLNGDTALMKLAVTLLFCYPGTPCIYYGDEVGLEGGPDPDCRRCFPWDESVWDTDLLVHYKKLASLRKAYSALQSGCFQLLYAKEDIFAFTRYDQQVCIICIINRGDHINLSLPAWQLPFTVTRIKSLLSNESIASPGKYIPISILPNESKLFIADSQKD